MSIRGSKSDRRIKNFIIQPQFQLRMSFYFTVSVLALFGVLFAVLQSYLNDVRFIILSSNSFQVATQIQINDKITDLVNFCWAMFALAMVISVGYSIIVSHRIAGPMHAICAYIDDFIKGNYEPQRSLRPYDELTPIMDKLHELGDKLKQKK